MLLCNCTHKLHSKAKYSIRLGNVFGELLHFTNICSQLSVSSHITWQIKCKFSMYPSFPRTACRNSFHVSSEVLVEWSADVFLSYPQSATLVGSCCNALWELTVSPTDIRSAVLEVPSLRVRVQFPEVGVGR